MEIQRPAALSISFLSLLAALSFVVLLALSLLAETLSAIAFASTSFFLGISGLKAALIHWVIFVAHITSVDSITSGDVARVLVVP